jgi:predicted NBD/HSP70 family sugar kinase
MVETSAGVLKQLGEVEGGMPEGMGVLAERVGQVLASIINFIDLQMVVIGGTAGIKNKAFIEAVQGEVERTLIRIPGRRVRVEATMIEAEAVAHGAAIAASDAVLVEGRLPAGGGVGG